MSSDDHKALSDELHEVFQERSADFLGPDDHLEDEGRETPATGFLTGFVLVCEWVGDDGEKWVTYHREPKQAIWLTRGLLSEALIDLEK